MTEPRSGRRPVALLAALVLLGAAACAGAAALTWWTAGYDDPLTGPLTLTATGSDCLPELVPVALVALAGFGAALATQGWLRRLVGVVLLAGGLLVAVRAVLAFAAPPSTLTSALVRPATPSGPAQLHPFGPALALAGGVLLALAGVLVAAGLGGRRRLGSRYEAPSAATQTAAQTAAQTATEAAAGDPSVVSSVVSSAGANRDDDPAAADPADWWKALDAGTDPTDLPVAKPAPPGGYHDHNNRAT